MAILSERMMELCEAVNKLDVESNTLYEPGTVKCLQTCVAQLVNDPSHEPNLKDLLVAAIVFHLKYTDN